MSIAVEKRLINVEEYHLMADAGILKPTDRVELINGEIIKMSPIGSKHAAVVDKINKYLNRMLDDQAIIRVQNPIITDEYGEPEPDISVLKPREDFYAEAHPTATDIFAIIEVGQSSSEFDKQIKGPMYSRSGVREYWLVDLDHDTLEVKTNPEGDIYKNSAIYTKGDVLRLEAFDVEIHVSKLIM